jgi:hypothetical protein
MNVVLSQMRVKKNVEWMVSKFKCHTSSCCIYIDCYCAEVGQTGMTELQATCSFLHQKTNQKLTSRVENNIKIPQSR